MTAAEAVLRSALAFLLVAATVFIVLSLTVDSLWLGPAGGAFFYVIIFSVHAQAEYNRRKEKGEVNAY